MTQSDSFEENCELVATNSSNGIRITQYGCEPRGCLLEQLVAKRVAMDVIDGLELVQVDEENGEPPTHAALASEGLVEVLFEECAVGQACELVVEREVAKLVLERLLI